MERWHDIPGYEGIYRVSSTGRVKSLPRTDARGNRRRGSVLRSRPVSSGRSYYQLCRKGTTTLLCASVLMALALGIPNPRRLRHVVHVNGDHRDFRRGNLRWVTPAEQRLHEGNKADSAYYGVIRDRRNRGGPFRWIMQLSHDRQRLAWQRYATEEEAAYAYDREVRRRGLKRPLNGIPRPRAFKPPKVAALPGEFWRPFPGAEQSHLISSQGRVRTRAYVTTAGQRIRPKLRKIYVARNGCRSVLIRGRRYAISTVLAKTFQSPGMT